MRSSDSRFPIISATSPKSAPGVPANSMNWFKAFVKSSSQRLINCPYALSVKGAGVGVNVGVTVGGTVDTGGTESIRNAAIQLPSYVEYQSPASVLPVTLTVVPA